MRTASVAPHFRCNQACVFCDARRAHDELAQVQPAAVVRRVEAALASGAEEVVFSGGEPTLRGDLEALVQQARRRGARRVTIETNATLIDEARARRLQAAGVDLARVHLSGWGPALDRVTRDEGGFEAAVRGVEALLLAGVPVEIAATVARSTAPLLPGLPGGLVGRFGDRLQGLALAVPRRSPDPDELLAYRDAVPLLLAIDRACRAAGLALRFVPGSAPPPCVFPPRERPPHLYSLSPGGAADPGHRRVAACAGCLVADRCPGVAAEYLDRFGEPEVFAVREDRARRRLSMVGTAREQIARELVSPTLVRLPGQNIEHTIRVQFQCNQACHFCFVSTHLPHPSDAQVQAAIVEAARVGAKVVLSGGEPTLHPRLAEHVRLARSLSPLPVQIQTNAVRLADAALCRGLREAGVAEAFVSLHGSQASISDAITQAPGTFDKTLRGIDNLVAEGVKVILNFVVCSLNLDDIVPFTDMASSRWPSAQITFSFIAPSSDLVPADEVTIPRYSRAVPALLAAIDLAASRGVETGGLDSMCGIPLCLLPPDRAAALGVNEIPPNFDEGECIKTETCEGCSLSHRCFGLRRRYAQIHGADELRRL